MRAPEGSKGQGHYVDGPRKNFAGGAGLIRPRAITPASSRCSATAARWTACASSAPRTVALMTTNQVGTLHSPTGLGFGLGFETVDRYGANGLAAVGAFGWGGAYGTNYQVDPKSRTRHRLHDAADAEHHGHPAEVPHLVYQALVN